jgi:hypothetical protein
VSWLESSWDIQLDDNDDAKYWRFVGEDWLWAELSDEHVKWIEKVGKARDKHSKANTKIHYSKGDSQPLNISGVATELIASYFTKEKINQISELRSKTAADLGSDIEVKSTRYSKNWRMYVNESQLMPNRRYIFGMTFLYPKYVALLGWCYGRQFPSRLHEFAWRDKERAYMIDYQALNNMNTWEHNASL